MKCWLLAIVVTCAAGIWMPARAGVITVNSDPDDYRYTTNLGVSQFNDIGAGSYPETHQSNFFYIFELPTLAANEAVTSADLTFGYTYRNWPFSYNVDLWGVGFQGSTTPIQEFFNNDTGDTGNTKIDDDLITPSTSYGTISTGASGDAALASYLQGFYDVNPDYSGGDYVFLRLNHDLPDPASARFIQVTTGESGTPPVLTLTVDAVPEPSACALLGIATLGVLGCGWRRKQKV